MKKWIRKKSKKRISLLMTVLIVLSVLLPIFPAGKSVFAASVGPSEITYETTKNYQHVIYANGQPLLIVASEADIRYARLYIDSNGNGVGEEDEEVTSLQGDGLLNGNGIYYVKEKGYFLVNTSIYGGGKEGICEYDTNITITGASNLSNAKSTVYAVYGGNQSGTLIGNTSIRITGGNAGFVYGGNYSGEVRGNSNIFIDTVVKYSVYGGNANSGKMDGNTTLTFGEHANVSGSICGGGKGNENDDSMISEVAGSANIIINGGTFAGSIYGGGSKNAKIGSSNITINDGTINNYIYNGGFGRTSVTDKASITVNGGSVNGVIASGGGYTDAIAEIREAEIHLNGGTVNYVYAKSGEYSKINQDLSLEVSGDTFSNTSFYLRNSGENDENKLQNVSVTLKNTKIAVLWLSVIAENKLSITFDNASVVKHNNFYIEPDVLAETKESTLSYLNCGSKEGQWGSFDRVYSTVTGNDNPVLMGYYLSKNKFTNIIFKDSYINYYDYTSVNNDEGLRTYAETLTIDGGALRMMNGMDSQMPDNTIFQNNPLLLASTSPFHFSAIPQGTACVQWLDEDGTTEFKEGISSLSLIQAPEDTPDNTFVSGKSDMGLTTTSSFSSSGGTVIWSGKVWNMSKLDALCTCRTYSSSLIENTFAITDENVQNTFTLKDTYADVISGCPVVGHKGNHPVFTYSILSDKTTISNASIDGNQLTVDSTGWVHIQTEQNMNGKIATYDGYVKIIEIPKENTFTFTKGIAEDIEFSFGGGNFTTTNFDLSHRTPKLTYLQSDQYVKEVDGDTFRFRLKKDYLNTLELGEYQFTANVKIAEEGKTYPNYSYRYLFTINIVPPKEVNNPTIELSKDSFNYDGTAKEPSVVVKDGDVVIPSSEYSIYYEDNVNVGTAKVTITDNEGGNYIVSGSTTFEIVNNYQPKNGVDYVATLNKNGWTNSDFVITANDGYLLSMGNTVTDDWVTNFTKTEETDNGSITFYVKNIETGEISLAVTQEYKIDKTNPEQYDITFNKNSVKQFINTISFGLFFNENIDVEIVAEDALSGIDNIVYFKSETALTEEQLKAISESEWISADHFSITAQDKETFIIYVKITDQAENVICFASNGAEFDLTSPVITGVKDGEIYYTTQSVTVTDENIDTITLNGQNVSNPISLLGNRDETYMIKAVDKAKNETIITVTMKPISSLADLIENITEENVTSDDKEILLSVSTINIDTAGASQEEKDELEAIVDKCTILLQKIAQVQDEFERVEYAVNSYDSGIVTSANKPAIEVLIQDINVLSQSSNLTEEEKSAVGNLKVTVTALLEKITSAQAIFNAEEIKAVEEITENTVKSSDNAALEKAKSTIEFALKEYEKNYTEEEKQKLQTIFDTCTNLLEKVDKVQKEVVRVENAVNSYGSDTVTSADKSAIEVLIQDIDVLLQSSHLTEEEKSAVGNLKVTATALLEKITSAQAIFNAEEIKVVEKITENTVKSSDNAALEKAKSAIESALKEYEKNYTEEEKQKLQTTFDTCTNLLEKVDKVQKEVKRVENVVNSYDSSTVTSADKPAIEVLIQDIDVLSQSSNLTEEEKSAVGDLKAAATALLEKITSAQAIFNAEEIKAVEEITENTVKSSDNAALEKAKSAIESALKEYEKNYTEEEKQKLQIIFDTCNQLFEKIDEVQKEVVRVENIVNSYDIATVTSADKSAIEVLIQDIDVLLQSNNLTEEEKSTVGGLKVTATALLEKITSAQAIFNAEEIKAVEEITENTVKSSDNAALEKAKSAIESALKEYEKNYTEEEKQKLQTIFDTYNQLLEKIGEVQREVVHVENTVNSYDSTTVTSVNKAAIEVLIQGIDKLLQSSNLTEEEKSAVGNLKATATALLEKIDEVQREVVHVENAVNSYDSTTVTSVNKAAIEVLIQGIDKLSQSTNLTEEEKSAVGNLKVTATALLEKITSAQAIFNAEEIKAVEKITENTVKSSDNAALEKAKSTIESALKEYEKNYTEEEKQKLQTIYNTCNQLLEKVDGVQKEVKQVENAVNSYDSGTVTSANKPAIEVLIQDINELSQSSNLTEEEKIAVGNLKVTATALLEKITSAQTAINTEDIKAVETISKDTVKLTDKEALEKAKIALESALNKYNNHYTEAEKQEINANITCISQALESIQKVQATIDFISKLPNADSVSPDDIDIEDTAKQANSMLELMTEHEKSFVDIKNLEAVWKALLDYKILEGDGNKWTQDSNGSITFKANGSVQKLKSVFIDGILVDKENYTVKEGSTIITLRESYLNTLSVGNHYLTLYYLDGETSAIFEIEASLSDDENKKPDDSTQPEDENKKPDTSQPEDENKKPDAPQSGDKNSLLLWITLLLMSGFGMIGKIVYSAKKR